MSKDKLAVALFRVGSAAEEKRARAYMGEYGYTVLEGHVPEKISLRQLQDSGHAIAESPSGKVNGLIDELMGSMLAKLSEEMGRASNDKVQGRGVSNDNRKGRVKQRKELARDR